MKRIFSVFLAVALVLCISGCANSSPSTLDDHGYMLTLNKQIAVVTNQLTTQMGNTKNVSPETLKNIAASAESSARIIGEAIAEVKAMPAPAQYEVNRQNALRIMETSREHIMQFIERLKADDGTADYADIAKLLQSDFTTLTGEFNVGYK